DGRVDHGQAVALQQTLEEREVVAAMRRGGLVSRAAENRAENLDLQRAATRRRRRPGTPVTALEVRTANPAERPQTRPARRHGTAENTYAPGQRVVHPVGSVAGGACHHGIV